MVRSCLQVVSDAFTAHTMRDICQDVLETDYYAIEQMKDGVYRLGQCRMSFSQMVEDMVHEQ